MQLHPSSSISSSEVLSRGRSVSVFLPFNAIMSRARAGVFFSVMSADLSLCSAVVSSSLPSNAEYTCATDAAIIIQLF